LLGCSPLVVGCWLLVVAGCCWLLVVAGSPERWCLAPFVAHPWTVGKGWLLVGRGRPFRFAPGVSVTVVATRCGAVGERVSNVEDAELDENDEVAVLDEADEFANLDDPDEDAELNDEVGCWSWSALGCGGT